MSSNQVGNQVSHGGKRQGAGRTAGAKTKARKVEIVHLADKAKAYTDAALNTLVEICQTGSTESARVAAANAILDRAYGKPKQAVDVAGGVTVELVRRVVVNPDAG